MVKVAEPPAPSAPLMARFTALPLLVVTKLPVIDAPLLVPADANR
jgi:hypothetical protein